MSSKIYETGHSQEKYKVLTKRQKERGRKEGRKEERKKERKEEKIGRAHV